MSSRALRIALPKGRLYEDALARFARAGYAPSAGDGRRLLVPATDGSVEFLTVKPGRVPWVDGRLQAPHLLVGVFARGLLKRVATRMYFPDEEAANAEDPVLLGLEPEERATLVARAEDGTLRFDVVLQGPRQTTFFAV